MAQQTKLSPIHAEMLLESPWLLHFRLSSLQVHLGKQHNMAHVPGPLPSVWETQMGFQSPGLDLAQSRLLWQLERWTNRWTVSPLTRPINLKRKKKGNNNKRTDSHPQKDGRKNCFMHSVFPLVLPLGFKMHQIKPKTHRLWEIFRKIYNLLQFQYAFVSTLKYSSHHTNHFTYSISLYC